MLAGEEVTAAQAFVHEGLIDGDTERFCAMLRPQAMSSDESRGTQQGPSSAVLAGSANPHDIRHQVTTMAVTLARHGNTLLALWQGVAVV